MDGYAVVAADTSVASREHPAELRLVESIFTGSVPHHAVSHGECAAIATGAPIPDGADAVVMVEYTDIRSRAVELRRPAQVVGRTNGDSAWSFRRSSPNSIAPPASAVVQFVPITVR
jgi:molybdopterin biosynthesis enzyme